MSEHDEAKLARGKVKWFSDQKGYGFIARDEAPDVFVHHTAIEMEGFRTLRQGEDVLYEMRDSIKGPQAAKVTRPAEREGGEATSESEAFPNEAADYETAEQHSNLFAGGSEERQEQ